MIKQTLGAFALAMLLAASPTLADDHAAPAADAAMAPAATEKCETTKDGVTSVADVAVGSCEKDGGKLVTDAPAAEEPKAEEKKAE